MTINPECSRVVSPCNFDGLAMSFLAFSVASGPRGSVRTLLSSFLLITSSFANRELGYVGHTRKLIRKWGQHYYIVLFSPLSPFQWPQNSDVEWLSMAWRAILRYMFTITNCHWLIICYFFTVVCLLHLWPTPEPCDQRRSAESGVANSDLQNIWNPRKIGALNASLSKLVCF